MDHLSSLFGHFTPTARAFFSGNLCTVAAFDDPDGLGHLHILKSGRLRVSSPGHEPIDVSEPCIMLVPRYAPHRFEPDRHEGADLICATIEIGGGRGNPIALGLPELLIVPVKQVATIAPTLELLLAEAFAEHDGRQVALDRLFEYLVVQVIRHVVGAGIVSGGVLAALADPRLARAVTAMHDTPERLWTLDDLAEVAGMSRTVFARHFRTVAGSTPMDYLTRWRMTIAQNLLRKGKPIKTVASAVGYESPAALTRTFAKVVGASPRQWLGEQAAASKADSASVCVH
ncbi:MAG: cupin domain-containing protein [Sphingomonadaceae bacterium]